MGTHADGKAKYHWLLGRIPLAPPVLPLSRYSHAHFRYMGRGGWAGAVLSRTSPATPSYNTVKLRSFGRVHQSADTHAGEVVSTGVELELHAVNGDTVWHLFISSPRQREPNSLPLQPGHYRMMWLPQTNNWRIEAMDPDDGELLHRARHDHQGRPQQLSAHLQEHELQQLQREEKPRRLWLADWSSSRRRTRNNQSIWSHGATAEPADLEGRAPATRDRQKPSTKQSPQTRKQKARSRGKQRLAESSNSQPGRPVARTPQPRARHSERQMQTNMPDTEGQRKPSPSTRPRPKQPSGQPCRPGNGNSPRYPKRPPPQPPSASETSWPSL